MAVLVGGGPVRELFEKQKALDRQESALVLRVVVFCVVFFLVCFFVFVFRFEWFLIVFLIVF